MLMNVAYSTRNRANHAAAGGMAQRGNVRVSMAAANNGSVAWRKRGNMAAWRDVAIS